MCSGAIVQSRIKKLIIGTKHIKNLNIEKQHEFKIDYFDTCNVEVTFDILKDECSSILQEFFKKLKETIIRRDGRVGRRRSPGKVSIRIKPYRGFESRPLPPEQFNYGYKFAVLDGEVAVPVNLQSAIARLNSV